MAELARVLAEVLPEGRLLVGDARGDDYDHDESLTAVGRKPVVVVIPESTDEVAAVLRVADELRFPVTARGAGTGLSGACVARPGGIVVSFERMNAIVEIDTDNHVAVVQPGVTLDQLDEATAAHGLVYATYPGENSATIGGNVATNAGGMRAVKYGVTRHQVLGLEAVLPGGDVVRTSSSARRARSRW